MTIRPDLDDRAQRPHLPRALALAFAAAIAPGCGDDGTPTGDADTGSTGDTTMTSVGSTGGMMTGVGSTGGTMTSSTGPDPDSTGGDTTGEPATSSDGGTDSSSGSGSDGGSGSSGGQMMVNVSMSMQTFTGTPLPDGDLCTADGCVPYTNSAGSVDLPAFSDTEVWVVATGIAETHYQFSTFDQDLSYNVISSSDAEQTFLTGLFGATLQPGMGHIAQRVDSPTGVAPTIDTAAEGPYYLTLTGMPDAAGTSTTPGGGFYIFLNIAPGDHTITLPGCDEGDGFWGPDSDEDIDVTTYADATVALFNVTCP